MSNSLVLTEEMRSLLREKKPRRAILVANALISLSYHGKKVVLYHDRDPVHWKRWFPPYVQSEIIVPQSVAEGDIDTYLENNFIPSMGDRITSLHAELGEYTKNLLALKSVLLSKDLFTSRLSLKFSATQNVWTFYCLVFFQATKVSSDIAERVEHRTDLAFLPVSCKESRQMPVVDNMQDILADQILVGRLTHASLI